MQGCELWSRFGKRVFITFSRKPNNILQIFRIPEDDGNGAYNVSKIGDFEYVNPIKFYEYCITTSIATIWRNIFSVRCPQLSSDFIEDKVRKDAVDTWTKTLKQIRQTEVPKNILAAFKADSKKVQVKSLKNASIDADNQLPALAFKLWEDYGYTLSQYTSEHLRNGLDEAEMPFLVELEEGRVNKVGATNLTDGQLKQAVEYRRVIISKFFDSGEKWHCLFYTYESLGGKESWNNGQPHYHYISDKFGFSRSEVLAQLKNRKYNLGNLPHVAMITNGSKKEG